MGLDLTALAGQPDEGDDPITGFLRRLMASRGAAGYRSPVAPSFMAGRVAPRPEPVAPAPATPAAPVPAAPEGIGAAAAALSRRTFAPVLAPSTKTDPGGSLKFAWGAGTPEDYRAGQTNILQMEGAPGRVAGVSPGMRTGFMGASPVSRGAGGYAPSETDWSKVANPMAFDAFRERPLRSEIERAVSDPLWRERELKEMDVAGAERVARAEAEAQIQAAAAEARRQREEIDRLVQEEINRQNQARATSGQKALSPDEEEALRSRIGLRFGVGFGLR